MYNNLLYKVLISKNNAIKSFLFVKKHLLLYIWSVIVLSIILLLFIFIYSYFFSTYKWNEKSFLFGLIYLFVFWTWIFFYLFAAVLIGIRINATMNSDQAINIFFKNRTINSVKVPWIAYKYVKKINLIILGLKKDEEPLNWIYKISYDM